MPLLRRLPPLLLGLTLAGAPGARAHVPLYDCDHNCCHAKYDVSDVDDPDDAVSQAFYMHDGGGVEFDVADFNAVPNEGQLVYVDAVFKKEYPPDAFGLYIGCGGCAPGDAVVGAALKDYEGYGRNKLEPFTQHNYRSYFMDDWRTFNTSALATCNSKHWSIRLVRNASSTSMDPDEKIFWSAVVGRREWFDLVDLFLYPMYVLRNHNEGWNELYSIWWVAIGCVVGALALLLSTAYYHSLDFFTHSLQYRALDEPNERWRWVVLWTPRDWRFAVRSVCYALAVLFLAIDFFEVLINGIYAVGVAQASAGEVCALLFLVLLLGKIGPLLVIAWIWDSMRRHAWESWAQMPCWCRCWCRPVWHPVYAHVNWAWLEIATGLSFFLLFGLGFWVTPLALVVAGLVRLGDYGYLERARAEDVPPNLAVAAVDENMLPDAQGRKRSSLTLEEFQRVVAQAEEDRERKLREQGAVPSLVPLPDKPEGANQL